MKINFDVVTFANYQLMGVGVIIRDCLGDFLARFSVRAPLLLDVKCSEACAASCVVKIALEVALFNIHVKRDCLLVIKKFAEGFETLSYAGSLLSNVHRYLATCYDLTIAFVYSEGNSVAHSLAE